jgi:hypothetical protein
MRHACSKTTGPSASGCSLSLHAQAASPEWPCAVRAARGAGRPRSAIKVEGIAEQAGIVAPVSDALEWRDAVIPAGDRLAVDDARAGPQPREGLDDEAASGG